ncbi:MAG: PDZ domain-containing protein [Pirellulales bacterium]|nr:PDZ domain-containing protein [Pirellulales bacterium]
MKRFTLTLAAAFTVFGFASMASANDDLQKFLQQLNAQKGQQGQPPQQKMMQPPAQQGGQQAAMMVGPGQGMPFQRWRLGVTVMDLNNPWNKGVYISSVDPFGPASRAYLSFNQIVSLEAGDRILQVDGQQVFGTHSLRHILNQNHVGWAVLLIRDVRTFQIRQVYVQLEPVGGGGGPVVMMNQGQGGFPPSQQQAVQGQVPAHLKNFLKQLKKK